jgi:DDE domain
MPEFERRWNQFARPVGPSWRVDETYVKIRGKWVRSYWAVDRDGKTVDFRLSTKRDVTAAKAFFCKAIKVQGSPPRTITLDGYAASHRAVRDMQAGGQLPTGTKLRSSKYLNNLIEQDHSGVKLRIGPMLGFKRFETAAITIACCAGSTRDNSISAGCASRVEVRPPPGMMPSAPCAMPSLPVGSALEHAPMKAAAAMLPRSASSRHAASAPST